jgi:hypothetical protein
MGRVLGKEGGAGWAGKRRWATQGVEKKRGEVGRGLVGQAEASKPRMRKKLRPTGKMGQRGVD